jgi:hypothetical protein
MWLIVHQDDYAKYDLLEIKIKKEKNILFTMFMNSSVGRR